MAEQGNYQNRDGDEQEEEEELDEFSYRAQKDALLFAIDVSASMLQRPPASEDRKADKDSGVTAALKCAYQIIQQRIISNPKDMVGILLYNTQKTRFLDEEGRPSKQEYPHCYVYVPLDVPCAEDLKTLKNLVEDEEDAEEILTPSDEPVPIKDVFFCANQIMTMKAPNFGSRRLFIVTDSDDPHNGNKSLNEAATVRAKDLFDMRVFINIFPILRGNARFDLKKFWDDVRIRDTAAELTDPDSVLVSKSEKGGPPLLKELITNVNSKKTPKRALFSNRAFEIGPGLTISVKGYNVIHKQKPARDCYVWLEGEKKQIAVGTTSRIAEDSARTVEAGELKKAYKFGGEYVYFSEEEQKSLKEFGDPIIRVIGFKDRSLLQFWMSISKSTFIYPSEEGFVGSTRVFSALWLKLLRSQKIGIAWHVARRNANPQLVAIVPSKSQSDETSGTSYLPAGLWLCPLPFADDVRAGPETQLVRTTDQLTDKMNILVRQLQLPGGSYDPAKYPNPALQWHYKILQALALEEEVPEKAEDATVPKNKAIGKRAGGYIEDWARLADEVSAQLSQQVAIKRELDAPDDDAPPPAKKKAKPSPSNDAALSDATLKNMANSGELAKLKVAELREALAARGIDTKGLKKADLVDKVDQWAEGTE